MKNKLLALIFAIALVIAIPLEAYAEFGGFAGDTDYGSDYGSSYDWGSSYDNDYDYDYDNDYDYDDDDDSHYSYATTTYYSYIYGSHTDDNDFGGYYNYKGDLISLGTVRSENYENEANYSLVGGSILLGIILAVVTAVKKSGGSGSSYKPPIEQGAIAEDTEPLRQMNTYTAIDPEFSETELKEKITNIYVQMQDCWQNKNIETLRPYLTDSLYAQYDRQLDSYRRKHETNYVDRVAVLGVNFSGWRQAGDNDFVVATVRTRIVDYVVNDDTGKVIRGSDTKEKFMTYEWTLSRKSGVKTEKGAGETRVIHCPNCGAPIDINKSAKCEYCGSIVTVDSTDWTITEIKGIAQRTVG